MSTTYQQIVSFLKALDKELKNPTFLYIVGGGSITLSIDKENRTVDLDVVEASKEVITKGGVHSKLAEQYGIYIQKIADIGFAAPIDWRNKVKPITDIKLNRITIYAANVHDVVLGKIARLEHRDIEDINDLMKREVININYLLQRLNQNTKELKKLEYRQNSKLLFDLIFNKNLVFQKGQAIIAKY